MKSVTSVGSGTSTWSTLLERAKANDQQAWKTLTDVYSPLVYAVCRRKGVDPQDAQDIVQDVFRKVALGLVDFRHDRPGDSFRGWLATIARNCIRDHFRMQGGRPVAVGGGEMVRRVQEVPDWDDIESTVSSPSAANVVIIRQALRNIRSEFKDRTWEAFWKSAVEGGYPADIARQLGISRDVVHQAKSRVLRRLRKEVEGLLE